MIMLCALQFFHALNDPVAGSVRLLLVDLGRDDARILNAQ